MARFGDVGRARFLMRSEDARHPRVFRAASLRNRFRDIIPTAASISGHLRFTVIRADPDYPGLHRRFGDSGYRAMLNGCARLADLRGIVGRQVGADLLPCLSAIARAEQNL